MGRRLLRASWLSVALLLVVLGGGCTAEGPAAGSAAPAADASMSAAAEAMTRAMEEASAARESPQPSSASPDSRRYALVFGNGAYRHGDALAAPARDAALIAAALQARGYHVLVGIDRDLAGMREDIAAFEAMSRNAELRLLYFAGHGFEFDHANYLMPVDLPAGIGDLGEQDVRTNAVRLDQLVWELEQDVPVLVAIVDACRVPPARGAADLPALAAQEPPEGAILAYATAPGRVAMDSLRAYGVDEEHSPYSYYLADALASPEVESWDQAFLVAYNIVNHRTRGAQQPWLNARVNRFPAVGPLQSAATAPGTGGLSGFTISSERKAAGRYWADEALAARRLADDRTHTDARLHARAGEGDARAALALATRWSEQPGLEHDAIDVLWPLAVEGNAVAQLDLGTLLYALAAEDRDGRSARYWWAQASAQGIGEAKAKLAIIDGDPGRALEELVDGMKEHFEAFRPRLEELQ